MTHRFTSLEEALASLQRGDVLPVLVGKVTASAPVDVLVEVMDADVPEAQRYLDLHPLWTDDQKVSARVVGVPLVRRGAVGPSTDRRPQGDPPAVTGWPLHMAVAEAHGAGWRVSVRPPEQTMLTGELNPWRLNLIVSEDGAVLQADVG